MQYLGYTYSCWLDEDDDVRKKWYDIIRPDGSTVDLKDQPSEWRSISPYRDPTLEEFKSAVMDIRFEDFCKKRLTTATD